jgi:hypothetical protein
MRFSLLVLVLGLYGVQALETKITGTVSTDVGVYYDQNMDYQSMANHDIYLGINGQLDEGVSALVNLRMYSSMLDATGERRVSIARSRAEGAVINTPEAQMQVHDVSLRWNFTEGGTLLMGDLFYSAGGTSYYAFSSIDHYSAILPLRGLRGVGFHAADGKVYFGSPLNEKDHGILTYLTYDVPVINKIRESLVVSPVADLFISGSPRAHRLTFGTEFDYSKTTDNVNYGVYGAWSWLRLGEDSSTHTLLVEPSMVVGMFSLGAVGYYAFQANKNADPLNQAYMPEQNFVVLEPGLQFHRLFAMGIPLEYHDKNVAASKDEYYRGGLAFYLYPTQNAALTAWGAYDFDIDNGSSMPNVFSFGITANADF